MNISAVVESLRAVHCQTVADFNEQNLNELLREVTLAPHDGVFIAIGKGLEQQVREFPYFSEVQQKDVIGLYAGCFVVHHNGYPGNCFIVASFVANGRTITVTESRVRYTGGPDEIS